MGCFSWITQNSNRSIIMDGCGTRRYPSRTYYMWDNTGRRWRETSYQGYGVFGGKDYYVLLAEMNYDYDPKYTEDDKRDDGIGLEFREDKTGILFPNLTDCKEWTWQNKKPLNCPSQGGGESNADYSDDEEYEEDGYRHTVVSKYDDWPNGCVCPRSA